MAGNGLARRGEEDGKRRGKKRALRGGIHPQGSDDYSFFVAPQEKLKSAGEEKVVLQEHQIPMASLAVNSRLCRC